MSVLFLFFVVPLNIYIFVSLCGSMSEGTGATGAVCVAARDTVNADNNTQQREAEAIIARLGMRPHVEGGYYAMADNDAPKGADAARAPYSVIYFLLTRQQKSHWHKLDAAEVWFWHSGSPLEMRISQTGERVDCVRVLGIDLDADQRPQVTVPKDAWQTARYISPLLSRLSVFFIFLLLVLFFLSPCGCAASPRVQSDRARARIFVFFFRDTKQGPNQEDICLFFFKKRTHRPLGGWTLVSCMMAPQFAWSGFALAPPDWTPGTAA